MQFKNSLSPHSRIVIHSSSRVHILVHPHVCMPNTIQYTFMQFKNSLSTHSRIVIHSSNRIHRIHILVHPHICMPNIIQYTFMQFKTFFIASLTHNHPFIQSYSYLGPSTYLYAIAQYYTLYNIHSFSPKILYRLTQAYSSNRIHILFHPHISMPNTIQYTFIHTA